MLPFFYYIAKLLELAGLLLTLYGVYHGVGLGDLKTESLWLVLGLACFGVGFAMERRMGRGGA
jgi:hypothetical protein